MCNYLIFLKKGIFIAFKILKLIMKLILLPFCLIIFIITGCGKDDTNPEPQAETYITTSANSTWNYQESDNIPPTSVSNYTITSTDRDKTIEGKVYHIYSDSGGGERYLNVTGHDYYQYDSLPLGLGSAPFDRWYLKDDVAVGANWMQNLTVNIPSLPIPIPITITNTVAEKGISRTVNNVEYKNVIHVSTNISSALIPAASLTTNISSYYAPKFGLIENNNVVALDYLGLTESVNIDTKLLSADLK
jgi:hypothetical protein